MRVACPWFEPSDSCTVSRAARAPLGAVRNGICRSAAAPERLTPELLTEACNFGYGRGRCPHFPHETEADAVRFSWRAGRLVWILEKDFAPLRHGFLDEGCPDERIARQSQAFTRTCPS